MRPRKHIKVVLLMKLINLLVIVKDIDGLKKLRDIKKKLDELGLKRWAACLAYN